MNQNYLKPTGLPPLNIKCRGSPLPIPNREVKPDCADGTAVMWESMSLPFFRKPYSFIWIGFFVLKNQEYLTATGSPPLNIKSFFRKPYSFIWIGFFVIWIF